MSKYKKRMAVCIYGTWRGWDVAKHQILNFKHEITGRLQNHDDYTLDIDYFISTWDTNLEFTLENDIITGEGLQPIDVGKIKSDFDEYNLVGMKTSKQMDFIENHRKFRRCAHSKFAAYLAQQAMLMKAMHESECDFTYDYAMFIRPDVVYVERMFHAVTDYILNDDNNHLNAMPSRSMVVEHGLEYNFDYYNGVYLGDVFWFGSSVASDLYFQLFDNIFRRTPDNNISVSTTHTLNAMHMMYCNLHVYPLNAAYIFIRPIMYHITNKISDIGWATSSKQSFTEMIVKWDDMVDTWYNR